VILHAFQFHLRQFHKPLRVTDRATASFLSIQALTLVAEFMQSVLCLSQPLKNFRHAEYLLEIGPGLAPFVKFCGKSETTPFVFIVMDGGIDGTTKLFLAG